MSLEFPLDFTPEASKEFMQSLWAAMEKNSFEVKVDVFDHQRRLVISSVRGEEIVSFIINRDASSRAPNGSPVGPATLEPIQSR